MVQSSTNDDFHTKNTSHRKKEKKMRLAVRVLTDSDEIDQGSCEIAVTPSDRLNTADWLPALSA